MPIKDASVTASFDVSDEKTEIIRLEEDTTEEGSPPAPYGFAWIRVWCSKGRPAMVSTSGNTVQLLNDGVSMVTTETVIFNNEKTAQLKRPNATVIKVEAIGLFLDDKARAMPAPNFGFDPVLSVLRAPLKCFGAVSVTYSTIYARYFCAFSKDPNAYEANPTTTPPTEASPSEFSPMIVVGTNGTLIDSVSLRPPNRSEKGGDGAISHAGSFDTNDGGAGSNIVIELDSSSPIALIPAFTAGGLIARARIWVYFGSLPTVTPIVSVGSIDLVPGQDSFSTQLEVDRDPLNWSNGTSTATKYIPSGSITVTQTSSDFFVKHSGFLTPTFVSGKGTKIPTKVFLGSNQYKIGDEKVLGLGEVCLSDGGLAIAGTGSATATYTTVRRLYNVEWSLGSGKWFPSVTVSAFSDGRSGTFVVNAPSRKGLL